MIYLIVHKKSNVPVIAYADKEEMLKKLKRMEKKEERLFKKGLVPEEYKATYTYKVIKFRRKKNAKND